MPFPLEVGFDELRADPDAYVDAVFDCLESEFMVMPRGQGFVEFPTFESGYETLKRATRSFQEVNRKTVTTAVVKAPRRPACPALHAGLHASGVGRVRHASHRRTDHSGCPR
jgi:hypothetical protein